MYIWLEFAIRLSGLLEAVPQTMTAKHGITCEAAEKAYVVKAVTVASVAAFRRLRIHRQAKGRPAGEGRLAAGRKPSPRFISAKRTAFQSLLHQCR